MSVKSREAILTALQGVKAPGSRGSVVEMNQISRLEVEERSVFLEFALDDLNQMLEKSLRFQAEKAIHTLDASFEVVVEFIRRTSEESIPEPKSTNQIGTLLAVGSGKGGVGKSSMSVNLAMAFRKMGYSVGLLDCDIYGPSIPTMMGVEGKKPVMMDGKMLPIEAHDLKVMSVGFFLEPGQSVIWRGPMIHKLIQQFFHDVNWGNLDVLVIDLPPGTGDAPLSLTQTIPLTGAIMVSTPQHISLIDVHKGISMFNQVKVPVLGVIENMSHFVCPSCKHEAQIFDRGHVKEFCRDLGVSYLGDVPIDPKIREGADKGQPFVNAQEDSPAGKAIHGIAKRLQPFIKSFADSAETTRLVV